MTRVEVVPATAEHAAILGPRLRAGDAREIMAMGFAGGEEAIRESLFWSFTAWAALEAGEPVAIWGATAQYGFATDTVEAWALTGPRAKPLAKYLLPVSKQFVVNLQVRFRRIEALLDPTYEEAVRWTRWLGFNPGPESKLNGVVFQTIWRA